MHTRAPTEARHSTSPSAGASPDIGFLLADVSLKPLYTNRAAVQILGYARPGAAFRQAGSLQERIRAILRAERFALDCTTTAFLSGRRRYFCRTFLLESHQTPVRPSMVALLLERGADPNKSGAPWATPLAWARKKGHAEIESDLLRAGASFN